MGVAGHDGAVSHPRRHDTAGRRDDRRPSRRSDAGVGLDGEWGAEAVAVVASLSGIIVVSKSLHVPFIACSLHLYSQHDMSIPEDEAEDLYLVAGASAVIVCLRLPSYPQRRRPRSSPIHSTLILLTTIDPHTGHLYRVISYSDWAPVKKAIAGMGKNCHTPNSYQTPLHAVLRHTAHLTKDAPAPSVAQCQETFRECILRAMREGGCCASRCGVIGGILGEREAGR